MTFDTANFYKEGKFVISTSTKIHTTTKNWLLETWAIFNCTFNMAIQRTYKSSFSSNYLILDVSLNNSSQVRQNTLTYDD